MRTLPLAPHLRMLATCEFCPKMCRFASPEAEAEASEAATNAWKGTLIRLHAEGRLPLAGAVAEAAYRSTDSLLERTHCVHRHETPPAYLAVRTQAVAAGVAPPGVLSYIERVRRLGNPFAAAAELAARLREQIPAGTPIVRAGEAAAMVFFPGCAAVARAPEIVRDGLAVLSRVEEISSARPGARVACSAAGAGCCGYPLAAAGDLEGLRQLAERLAPALGGARAIVSPDPGCVYTLNVLWKEHAGIDLGGRATTAVEWLGARLDAVRAAIVRPVRGSLAYHDPCHLGRYRGVHDAPRALLAAASEGTPPRELAWNRENAWCCGAGAVYGKIWPDSANRIRDRRLAEFAESGAGRLATACPSCVRTFRKGGAEATDLLSVLAAAMDRSPDPR